MTSPSTWEGANCTDKPTDGWYPEKGSAQVTARKAKAVCHGTDGRLKKPCKWLGDCLDYAIQRNERFGVWGGMSERDRYKEKKRRREDAAAPLAPVIPIRPRVEEEEMPTKVERYSRYQRRSAAKPAPAARKAGGMLGRWADTKKDKQLVVPLVKQHLLTRPQDQERRHDLLHVSELAKSGWCPRAAYLRISSVRSGGTHIEATPSFQLDNIFEEGDRIHTKWQTWLWDMGLLWGLFRCYGCEEHWLGTSPDRCPKCSAGRGSLQYREVPMEDRPNLITGHADAEVRTVGDAYLIEVKSVGMGTIRTEQPKMLAKYTHTYEDENGTKRSYLDHDGLWRDLRQPFAAHRRQGLLYLYLRKLATEQHGWPPVDRIVFVYEYKPTQAVKEFSIVPDHEWVAEVLEDCKDIVYALDTGTTPSCKEGRHKLCKLCEGYEKAEHDAEKALTGNGARTRTRRRTSTDDAPAPRRGAGITGGSDRPGRQRVDESAGAPHSLGRLLGQSTGNGRYRRKSG